MYMTWEWNEQRDFEKGKRYLLKVAAAERKLGRTNGTEMLVLKFEDEEGMSAGDKTFYNTPKAAYRIKDWLKAFGYDITECRCGFDTQDLVGMEVYAESSRRKSTDPAEPDKEYLEWIKPESALPTTAAQTVPAQKTDEAKAEAQQQGAEQIKNTLAAATPARKKPEAVPEIVNPEEEIPF